VYLLSGRGGVGAAAGRHSSRRDDTSESPCACDNTQVRARARAHALRPLRDEPINQFGHLVTVCGAHGSPWHVFSWRNGWIGFRTLRRRRTMACRPVGVYVYTAARRSVRYLAASETKTLDVCACVRLTERKKNVEKKNIRRSSHVPLGLVCPCHGNFYGRASLIYECVLVCILFFFFTFPPFRGFRIIFIVLRVYKRRYRSCSCRPCAGRSRTSTRGTTPTDEITSPSRVFAGTVNYFTRTTIISHRLYVGGTRVR